MLERLFHKGKSGAVYSWEIAVEDDEIVTTYGLIDGQKQVARKRATPKNVGKKNETSAHQQAELQAQSMHKFKLDRKYSKTQEEAQEPLELPMLAYDFDKVKTIVYPIDLQPKLDGVRCIAKWDIDEVVLMSRSGKPFNVPHISEFLKTFLPKNKRLDGELYIHGKSFQEIITLIKRMQEGSEEIQFHVYDCITDDHEDSPWSQRYRDLCEVVGMAPNLEIIKLVPTWTATNVDEKNEIYVNCIEDGYEGAIARIHSGGYQYGYRSRDLLKIKTFKDGEYPISGAYQGEGKFEGCITWVCMTPEGKEFGVCPKGTLGEKKKAWAEWLTNPDSFIGELYKVKYFELTDDGIPRFPVGLGFRLHEDMSDPENGED
jgi:DNA ligase-1